MTTFLLSILEIIVGYIVFGLVNYLYFKFLIGYTYFFWFHVFKWPIVLYYYVTGK